MAPRSCAKDRWQIIQWQDVCCNMLMTTGGEASGEMRSGYVTSQISTSICVLSRRTYNYTGAEHAREEREMEDGITINEYSDDLSLRAVHVGAHCVCDPTRRMSKVDE